MLTNAQIAQIKAVNSSGTSAAPAQAMTPEQAKAWAAPTATQGPAPVEAAKGFAKTAAQFGSQADVLGSMNRLEKGDTTVGKGQLTGLINSANPLGSMKSIAGENSSFTGAPNTPPTKPTDKVVPNWAGQTPEEQSKALQPSNYAQKVGSVAAVVGANLAPVAYAAGPKIKAGLSSLKDSMTPAPKQPLAQVSKTINDHITTTQQIIDSMPKESLPQANAALIDRLRTNIVDGLQKTASVEGSAVPKDIITEISNLQAPTIQDFIGKLKAISTTPEEIASNSAFAASVQKQGAAHSAIEDEIRNTAAKYPKVMTALNNAEVVRGTKPIEVLSSYAKGEALPFLQKGKLQVDKSTQFLSGQVSTLARLKEKLVKSSPTLTPLENFQGRMNAIIDAQSWSNVKKLATKAEVQKITNPWKDIYPDGIPNEELDSLKTEQTGESTTYNSKSPFSLDAHGIVGKAARQLVESNTEHAPINELNKWISSHYDAIKLLNSMRGYTPHGGALSKMVNNSLGEVGGLAAGMVVGHPFLGAMAGRAGAEFVNSVVNNHFISNPLKRTLVNTMPGVDPGVVQKALDYIDTTSPKPPEAPAPEAIPGNSQTVSSPNDSTPTSDVKPLNQNPQAGFIKNPFASEDTGGNDYAGHADENAAGNGKYPTPPDPHIMVQNYVKTFEDMMGEMSNAALEKLGGDKALIQRLRTNIVDGLNHEGNTMAPILRDIANIKPKNIYDFITQLKNLPKAQGAAPNTGSSMTPSGNVFANSDATKDKNLVIPFTPFAQSIYTRTATYTDARLPEGGVGVTRIEPMLRNIFATSQNKLESGKIPVSIDTKQSEGSKISPEVYKQYEIFHVLFNRTGINPQSFNKAWEEAKSDPDVGPALERIDNGFVASGFQEQAAKQGEDITKDPYALATERFASAGLMLGQYGLPQFPDKLKPFYNDVIQGGKKMQPFKQGV